MKLKILTGGLLLASCMARAQSGVSSQGGTCHLGTASVQWTIGESIVSTIQLPDAVLTQGFDQHELSTVAAPINFIDKEVTVEIFPNPVATQLTIAVADFDQETSYSLSTIDGKPLLYGVFQSPQQAIDFSSYASGAYMLVVRQPNQPLKSFKIIKK
jgi:hypothetical protein